MIKLGNAESLYFIMNVGCDDETNGIAVISDEDFPKFKTLVENLNKNSTYGCQPKIRVYKINESMLEERDDEDYCPLYLNGKIYVEKRWGIVWEEGEQVI